MNKSERPSSEMSEQHDLSPTFKQLWNSINNLLETNVYSYYHTRGCEDHSTIIHYCEDPETLMQSRRTPLSSVALADHVIPRLKTAVEEQYITMAMIESSLNDTTTRPDIRANRLCCLLHLGSIEGQTALREKLIEAQEALSLPCHSLLASVLTPNGLQVMRNDQLRLAQIRGITKTEYLDDIFKYQTRTDGDCGSKSSLKPILLITKYLNNQELSSLPSRQYVSLLASKEALDLFEKKKLSYNTIVEFKSSAELESYIKKSSKSSISLFKRK